MYPPKPPAQRLPTLLALDTCRALRSIVLVATLASYVELVHAVPDT